MALSATILHRPSWVPTVRTGKLILHKVIYHHEVVFISISGCWICELCQGCASLSRRCGDCVASYGCASLSRRCGDCATSYNTERQGEEGVAEGWWFHKRRRWSPLFRLPQRKQGCNNRLVKQQFLSQALLLYMYELSFWIICRCQSDSRRLLQTVAWLL